MSTTTTTTTTNEQSKHWYILSALLENKPGVLFRVTNLFRARNFNIESITVGSTEQVDLSRMTITTKSDEKTLDQLVKQLRKLIDVVEVKVLDTDKTVFRELALIKMKAEDPTTRMEITNFASIFRANILDIGKATILVELTGTPDKIDAFKNLVGHYGIIQLARTGVSALPRGETLVLDMMDKVRIFDTTLRDGEQTPGVSVTPEQKFKIAIKLDEIGVDAIEVGFPIVSQGEMEAIKAITKQGLNAEVCGLARTVQADIDAAINCNLKYVHTFIATSDIHMQYKLKMSREQVLEKAIWAVDYAKKNGMQVEFSAEDATRSDKVFVNTVFKAVADAGADRLDIPDTVGYATPQYIAELVNDVKIATKLPVSIHCHDDFGLAVANAISGINAGASCAHVTINGLGERAGNASLEEFVMALQCLYNKKHNIKTELLYETSKLISNIMGIIVQPNKAIIGENAFGHESGIHTHGIINNPLTYEPISPELVGRKRWMQAGKHAGAHGIKAMLEEFGIKPTDEQLHNIVEKQKNLADKGKSITTAELLSIAGDIMHNNRFEEKFKLYDFHIVTGMNTIPTAVVRLNTDGKDFIASEIGVGPVDAALKAIQKVAGEMENIKIREYRLDSITGGSDALAEVSIKVEDKKGNIVSARKAGEDVVVASVQAMMDAINKIMLKKMLYSKN